MATKLPAVGVTLVDAQVLSLGAGQTLQTVSGTTNTVGTGTVQMTPNSVGSTQPVEGTVWHATEIHGFPGVLAPGATAPDLWVIIHIDEADFSAYIYIDLSIGGCMFPRPDLTVGQKVVKLGDSMILAAKAVSMGGPKPNNMPIRFTGWKVTDNLEVFFASTAGFSASTFVEPPTIQIIGDVLDKDTIDWINKVLGWNPEIRLQSPRRARLGLPPYTAAMDLPGGNKLSIDKWAALPDGSKQGNTKVHRFAKAAVLQVAVSGTTITPLSKINSVGGKVGNVPSSQDLGWDYGSTGNAIYLTHWGRRPAQGAGYAALFFGGTQVEPAETAYGITSTYGRPRIPFGQVQPLRADGNLYYPLSPWGAWSRGEQHPELVAGETAAMAVAAQNGQTILANTDETAVAGVVIEAPKE